MTLMIVVSIMLDVLRRDYATLSVMIRQRIPHVTDIRSFLRTVRIIERVHLPHADSKQMPVTGQLVLNADTLNIVEPDLMVFT